MVIGNHDNVISYVKLGPKALDFLQGRIRVMVFICFHTCFIGRAITDEQSVWYLTKYMETTTLRPTVLQRMSVREKLLIRSKNPHEQISVPVSEAVPPSKYALL